MGLVERKSKSRVGVYRTSDPTVLVCVCVCGMSVTRSARMEASCGHVTVTRHDVTV